MDAIRTACRAVRRASDGTTARPRALLVACAALALGVLGACAGEPEVYEGSDAAKVVVTQLELRDPTDRRVPIRVAYPVDGRALPVVLFSHAAYAGGADYDAILDQWAAHGYVVVAPSHPDAGATGVTRGDPAATRTLPQRLVDMKLVLDRIADIQTAIPALAGRVDARRVAAAGHGLGGLVAQTLGGATTYDAASGTALTTGRDARLRAVIVWSGPGHLPPLLRPEDWQPLALPTLVAVGGRDLAGTPGRAAPDWRREPYGFAPPGDKYLLVLRDADHWLGGAVGGTGAPRAAESAEWVRELGSVTLAFLDAYLRDDGRARKFLTREHEIGRYGTLEHK